jgi:membrane fusion protein, copper/silver efflux system
MRQRSIVVLLLAVGLGGFAVGRLIPSAPAPVAASSGRAIHHYACPMHPAVKSDRPGPAPCCGMALEPVYQDGRGAPAPALPAGAVTIQAGLRQLQGVKVGAVERTPSSHPLRLFGRVVPDEGRVFSVNAAMEGAIHDLAPVTTGSFVRRGQRLGSFFCADMRTALQAFMTAIDAQETDASARASAGLVIAAGSTPSRNGQYITERLRSLGVSDRQLEEMRRKREVPLLIDIAAPTDGLLLSRSVTAGQKYEKGAEWFRLANLDRVWIQADLQEGDVALVRPGATARVTVPGRPGTLTAVVSQVPPQFDAASRTMRVRLELENPGALLRPDMFVDAEVTVERPAALVIPADALIDSGLRRTVFVEQAEGLFVPRAVEIGWRMGDRVEVTSGLAAGERIVLSGTFLVDSESQLRAAAAGAPSAQPPASASAQPAAQPPASPSAQPPGQPKSTAGQAGRAAQGGVRDPICGMEVDEAKARDAGRTAEHGGRSYAFCSDGCRARFLASPEQFAGGGDTGHQHGQPAAGARSAGGSQP